MKDTAIRQVAFNDLMTIPQTYIVFLANRD